MTENLSAVSPGEGHGSLEALPSWTCFVFFPHRFQSMPPWYFGSLNDIWVNTLSLEDSKGFRDVREIIWRHHQWAVLAKTSSTWNSVMTKANQGFRWILLILENATYLRQCAKETHCSMWHRAHIQSHGAAGSHQCAHYVCVWWEVMTMAVWFLAGAGWGWRARALCASGQLISRTSG